MKHAECRLRSIGSIPCLKTYLGTSLFCPNLLNFATFPFLCIDFFSLSICPYVFLSVSLTINNHFLSLRSSEALDQGPFDYETDDGDKILAERIICWNSVGRNRSKSGTKIVKHFSKHNFGQ